MEYYFHRYGDLELHRRMVGDRWRTDAFAKAITEAVRPGDRVLDVGTGTGVLAMLAAKAGASFVHGIDFAEISKTAANLVKENGLEGSVKILRGAAAELQLEEPVDLLVSEWLGNFGFVEAMLDDVLAARDKNLRGDGRMLPSDVELWLAPLGDPVLYGVEGPGFWRRPVHGLDFTSLEGVEQKQGRAIQLRVDPASLIAPGRALFALDLKLCSVDDPFRAGTTDFTISRDGVVDGFCGWFISQLSPSVVLDTGPGEPETHWSQTYLSFPPKVVRAGETMSVGWSIRRDEEERRYIWLELTVDGVPHGYTLE